MLPSLLVTTTPPELHQDKAESMPGLSSSRISNTFLKMLWRLHKEPDIHRIQAENGKHWAGQYV